MNKKSACKQTRSLRDRPLSPFEKVERQQFQENSDFQSVGDHSIAVVLASLGWQDSYLNVNVPAFFYTIGRLQALAVRPSAEQVSDIVRKNEFEMSH
ncbi:hypothetical protein GCN74_22200 [Janthinobacterium sp. FT14W]|uniref:hypothetical protein n=1 Tax=Janthinobacterium sp. FT14W TaxID=2654253 RepID=UPI0012652287|nr:hypothetical protein [Janthinobacterium sp. FT14W]KAB8057100.1 hypothetical protein GCN74_22200 [Janthinobacterium sp. FT14W]